MINNKIQITVCVCTFKRQKLLKNLLEKLQNQVTNDIFDYSVVVVDNDRNESARDIVNSCIKKSKMNVSYFCEPEQNIALARNKAVNNARGDFIAFIDDDELPTDHWLLTLYETCEKWKVAGVLGPVLPYFEIEPPEWVVRGRFFERPTHETGSVLDWEDTRTGNVIIRRKIIDEKENRFNKKFLTSEDKDFFKRLIEKGYVFIWCNEAPVYEIVPPERWVKSFMLKRALFRGKISINYSDSSIKDILKSVAAVLLYTTFLPVSFLLGKHVFIKYLVKTCDHLGKILAYCGIDVVREKYVTE